MYLRFSVLTSNWSLLSLLPFVCKISRVKGLKRLNKVIWLPLQCSFSNGGHLFAAVHGNVIQLYSSTTFENVGNLKGHNGKVFNHIFKHEEVNASFPCVTEVRDWTRQIPFWWRVATKKRADWLVLGFKFLRSSYNQSEVLHGSRSQDGIFPVKSRALSLVGWDGRGKLSWREKPAFPGY